MKRIAILLLCVVSLTAVGGCVTSSRQPTMAKAQISPEHLVPGDTAIITVEVKDRFEIVNRIEGVVREDRTLTFKLRDDGVTPDKKAGDGIWTIQVDVPFNAPPGDFEFEIIAYDSDGEVVVIHDENNEAAPLSMSFGLVIEYRKDDEE